MSTFKFDDEKLKEIISKGMLEGALYFKDEVVKNVPRLQNDLPDNPKAKVTGNLKKSIQIEEVGTNSYKVGTVQGYTPSMKRGSGDKPNPPPDAYASHQEFGTIYMKPRSFLGKTKAEKGDQVVKVVSGVIKRLLK